MNDAPGNHENTGIPAGMSAELEPLLIALGEGPLAPEQGDRLAEILRRSPEARRVYTRHITTHATLARQFASPLSLDPGVSREKRASTEQARRVGSWRWAIRFAAAAVIVLGFATAMSVVMMFSVSQPVRSPGPPIAVLADASGAQWGSGTDLPTAVGSQLGGGFLRLKAGTVRIEFFSGAHVTLTGPCEFGLNSAMRGFLRRGRLQAYVPPPAHGFTIAAKGLAVVDLGTAFEMDVDDHGPAVRVLKGAVALIPGDDHAPGGRRVRLVAGNSARLDGRKLIVDRRTAEPGVPIDVLALLDTPGEPRPTDGGFDPRNGMWTGQWRQERLSHSTSIFHPTDRAIVDGVLLPGRDGMTQLDSAGHTARLPATDGLSLGPIWVRHGEAKTITNANLAWIYAFPLDHSWFEKTAGVLGLHPNSGICFDLKAIRDRARVPDVALTLKGRVADVRPADPHPGTSSFQIFIDGRPAFSCRGVRAAGRPIEFALPLDPHARLMTLVATDGGDSSILDWLIVGQLRLEPSSQQPASL